MCVNIMPSSFNVSQLLLNDVHQDMLTLHIGRMWDAHANHRKRGKCSMVQFIQNQLQSFAKTRQYYAKIHYNRLSLI